jgi:hypothetical protein
MSSRRMGRAAGVAVCVLTSMGLVGWVGSPAVAVACSSGVVGDINGDGHAEAAVGEPGDHGFAGAVHVFYGTDMGLVADASGTALNDQLFTQDTPGVPGVGERDDAFGSVAALADFNADGCADLAVGAPGENGGMGSVTILYGSMSGLTTAGARAFTENGLFGAGSGVGGEGLGLELTSGDFNDDGIADLAAGVSGEVVGGGENFAGGVVVVYGAAGGLGTAATASALITQATPGVPGTPEVRDQFGSALSAGDFDGHGVDDLAVGVPGENNSRGIVQVLPGQAGTGLGALGASTYSQDTVGVAGVAEADDSFGWAVAAGDATADGRDDLAVGAPGENTFRGAVSFLPGSPAGLSGVGSQIWSQDSAGVAGVAQADDRFGWSLVMAPLDFTPRADLAIGVPFDSIGPIDNAGSVNILLGRGSGLSTSEAGGERFHQDTPGIAGAAETEDRFGWSIDAAPIITTDLDCLLIGVPQEVVGNFETGAFHQLATSEFGPNPFGSVTLDLDSPGVKGTPDDFGSLFGIDVT